MFSHDCSVNQSDNSDQNSLYDVNSSKLSLALENAGCLKRKQQFSLRKYKSESSVREMGSRLSRSKSFENADVGSAAYESLKRKRISSIVSEESEDDYKLLESSEVEPDTDDTIEGDVSNAEGYVHAENSSSSNVNVNCSQHHAGNESKNELFSEKFSTLPRVRLKNENVDQENFARRSVPYKSLDNRAYCSKENIRDKQRAVEAIDESDKVCIDFKAFRSTTLPKTRPHCESFFRHSLRQTIDSTMLRKHSRISDASEHSAAIIPATNGSGKNICLTKICSRSSK